MVVLLKENQKIDLQFNNIDRKIYKNWERLRVPIIDIKLLFDMKIKTGRNKDIIDCVFLLKTNQNLYPIMSNIYSAYDEWEDIESMLDYPTDLLMQLHNFK